MLAISACPTQVPTKPMTAQAALHAINITDEHAVACLHSYQMTDAALRTVSGCIGVPTCINCRCMTMLNTVRALAPVSKLGRSHRSDWV